MGRINSLSATPIVSGVKTQLTSVWGSDPNNVYIAGQRTVLHWDGTKLAPADKGTWTTKALSYVWGTGPDDVWITGLDGVTGNIVTHWNGVSFSTMVPGATTPVLFGGTGPKDAWAIGRSGGSPGTGQPLLHWDGTGFTSVLTLPGRYGSAAGNDPGNIWIVGPYGSMARWDGGSLTQIDQNVQLGATGTSPFVNTVRGTGPRDVWFAGGGSDVLHWDGMALSKKTLGAMGASGIQLRGGGPAGIWAIEYPATGPDLVHYWDGKTWSLFYAPKDMAVYNVWGSGPKDVWLGEMDSYEMLHWDGAALHAVPNGYNRDFSVVALWGSGPDDVWAVGSAGNNQAHLTDGNQQPLLHWDGHSWKPVDVFALSNLFDIWGSGSGDMWAISDGGILHHLP